MKKLYLLAFFAIFVACTTDSDGGEFNASEDCPVSARGTFVDERDGQIYKYTTIGGQVWMAQNLNYNSDQKDYQGMTYPCSEASSLCPSGWHLPSQEEWERLYDNMGGIDIAGERLKASSGWKPLNRGDLEGGSDDCGFSLVPELTSQMMNEGFAADLCSSTWDGEHYIFGEFFYSNKPNVSVQSHLRSNYYSYSVRCLKN
ncbi:MAG: hypothetical protein MJY82_06270 [Fibrobacter sp.]|nr:hypothetical protein [Fibrobacter sp.]